MGKDLIKMKNYIPFGKPIVSNKEINLVNKVIKKWKICSWKNYRGI